METLQAGAGRVPFSEHANALKQLLLSPLQLLELLLEHDSGYQPGCEGGLSDGLVCGDGEEAAVGALAHRCAPGGGLRQ